MWVPGKSGNRLTIRRLLMHLLTGHLARAGPVVFSGLELFCGIVVKFFCKSVNIILDEGKAHLQGGEVLLVKG